MLIALAAPVNNERGPRYLEKALAAIHQANHERRTVTFECGSHDGRVGLFVRFAENLEELVAGPLVANYPNCAVTNVEDEALPADFEICRPD